MIKVRLLDLVETSLGILILQAQEPNKRNAGKSGQAKRDYDTLQRHFENQCNRFVDSMLRSKEDHEIAIEQLNADLSELRQTLEPSWLPAIDYLADKLVPKLKKEASKSPTKRKFEKFDKMLPLVATGLLLVAYFGTRFAMVTDIDQSIETRAGLEQRAEALSKVIRYDDWMDARVRRGGWMKGLLLWPIEPTEDEIVGAGEFAGLAFDAADFVQSEFDCRPLTRGYSDQFTDDQLGFLSDLAVSVTAEGVAWQDPAVLTVVEEARRLRGC